MVKTTMPVLRVQCNPCFISTRTMCNTNVGVCNHGFSGDVKEILEPYSDSHNKLVELNSVSKRVGTLPVSQKKEIVTLFRMAMEQDVKTLDAVKNHKAKMFSLKTPHPQK